MKTAEARIHVCMVCQAELPTGSRRDRKYCREACSERAYYQRHPNKKRVLTARTRTQAEADTRTLLRADELTKKATQLEIENASLRRDLKAARAKLADRDAANDDSLSQAHTLNAIMAQTLEAAEQRIKRLQAEAQQAIQDVRRTDQALLDANEKIEELQEQLRDATSRAQRAERAYKDSPRQQPSTEHATPYSQLPVEAAPRPRIEPLPSSSSHERRVAQQLSTRNASSQPLETQSATARVSDALPWERPAKKPGKPPIPRWKGMPQENFDEIYEFAHQTLDALPDELYNLGDWQASQGMRAWLSAPENVAPLAELSRRIVLRIVSIERLQRRNRAQRTALAPLVLDHAIETMETDTPAQAQEIREVFAVDTQRVLFERLTFELFEACRGKELLHDEQLGTWRFFVRA